MATNTTPRKRPELRALARWATRGDYDSSASKRQLRAIVKIMNPPDKDDSWQRIT